MMKTLEGRWTRLDDCLLNHPEELTMRATSYFGGQFKMAAAMSVVFFFFSFLSGLGAATTTTCCTTPTSTATMDQPMCRSTGSLAPMPAPKLRYRYSVTKKFNISKNVIEM